MIKYPNFIKDLIYIVKGKNFKYCYPVYTGDFLICNCIPCTEEGDKLKDYQFPVPVCMEDLRSCTGINRKGEKDEY